MRQVMVRYRVKPERVEENEELVRAAYAELRRTELAGVRYATFKLDNGVSFVHLASLDRADDEIDVADLRERRVHRDVAPG